MDEIKFEEIKKSREDSLMDIQIKYHELMFNKLKELKSLNKNYLLAKSITYLYLDNEEDHMNVYDQEKIALKYCLSSIKKIKRINSQLEKIEPLLKSKTDKYDNVYKLLKQKKKHDE